jgi:TetR/AcrR family transcriptional regulator, regulator of biofilm formation and stress response
MRGCVLSLSRDGRRASGIWEAQPSRMRAGYPAQEVDLVLAGRATVTTTAGAEHQVSGGVALVMPAGMRCEWHIHDPVRKLFMGRALPRAVRAKLTADVDPRPARARPDHGSRRQLLIEATVRIIARDGVEGVSYRSVAREAGVAHSLITYHFTGRDELLREALASAGPDTPPTCSLADQLRRILDARRPHQTLRYSAACSRHGGPVAAQLRSVEYRQIALVSDALRHAGVRDEPLLAEIISATIDGLLLRAASHAEPPIGPALDLLEQLVSGWTSTR